MKHISKCMLLESLEDLPASVLSVGEIKAILGEMQTYSIFGGESEITEAVHQIGDLLPIAQKHGIQLFDDSTREPIESAEAMKLFLRGKLSF